MFEYEQTWPLEISVFCIFTAPLYDFPYVPKEETVS